MSTPEYPKQFIDVMGCGRTMIQMTVERFSVICPMSNFWVVTSEDYVQIVHEQLPEIPVENIIAEPCARNTAPCIAYACWKIKQKDPSANIVVTPSDALVLDVEEFRRIVREALEFTAEGKRIVTLGIKPTRPETGYGYIAALDALEGSEICAVESFREKPSLEVAKEYLAAGNYLWNAGIFVWNVSTIVESLRAFAPSIAAKMDQMAPAFFTEREASVVEEVFPTCEKISIDYAVMEKADYIYIPSLQILAGATWEPGVRFGPFFRTMRTAMLLSETMFTYTTARAASFMLRRLRAWFLKVWRTVLLWSARAGC